MTWCPRDTPKGKTLTTAVSRMNEQQIVHWISFKTEMNVFLRFKFPAMWELYIYCSFCDVIISMEMNFRGRRSLGQVIHRSLNRMKWFFPKLYCWVRAGLETEARNLGCLSQVSCSFTCPFSYGAAPLCCSESTRVHLWGKDCAKQTTCVEHLRCVNMWKHKKTKPCFPSSFKQGIFLVQFLAFWRQVLEVQP